MSLYLKAGDYSEQINRANRAIASNAKSVIWKGYHDFQSLYMKGLLEGDKKLQLQALKGLIKASKALDIDATRYKNAIKALDTSEDIKEFENQNSFTAAPSESKSISKQSLNKSSKTVSKNRTISLKKTAVENSNLILTFNTTFSKKSIHKMVLKRRGHYLYVFDISPAKTYFSIKRIKGPTFKEIRIAQFDPKTVRVVIEVSRSYKPKWKIKGRRLFITLPKGTVKRHQKKDSVQKNVVSKTKNSTKKNSLNLSKYIVVIDPGHGGKDSGAVGYKKLEEKKVVLSVAKKVRNILKKRGFKVYLTRSRDKFVPLKKRTRFANLKDADFFISIHANAVAGRKNRYRSKGIETFFLSPARSDRAKRVAALENSADVSDLDRYTKETYLSVLNREKIIESNKLAIDLQKQILSSLRSKYRGVVDNGVREGPFWVLVGAQMPAVLIEIGYITHPTESKRLFNPYYQKLLAEGIANGIESYIRHNR
ncbi:N-acetylmuramoyl-L-alanine amidase [Hydrogenimonas thermophila]|uniref:N-acetylmuramoyl-L-alanine amidase n=1 Tax=Hydrogenimonas thermophila TaxID=223786 RepID=UPI001C42F014|nr:N-acetylmuramoyl-L-alanine amidase [Hydrogenimonas thermophila]